MICLCSQKDTVCHVVCAELDPKEPQVILFGDLMDSHSWYDLADSMQRASKGCFWHCERKVSLECTEDTVYVASILNLGEDGPTVIEVPGGAGPGTASSAAIVAT